MQQYHYAQPRNPRRDWVIFTKPHFKIGDFAITWTFKPTEQQYKLKYQPDVSRYTEDVRHFINVANYMLLGKNRPGAKRLACAYAFELNNWSGMHLHMVLENPDQARIEPHQRHEELYNAWMKMRCSGSHNANKVKSVYEVEGWVRYIFKGIKAENTENIDINNWHLPDRLH